MIHLINAELLKIRTTWTAWGLLIALVPLVALNAFIQFATYHFATPENQPPGSPPPPALTDPQAIRGVLSGALSAKTLVLLLGILMITAEFRHMTVTPTFLSSPQRSMVVGAKLGAGVIIGVVFAAAALLVDVATGYICYAIVGETFTLNVDKAPQAILGIFLVITVYALIGIGLGALLKNQIAAILVGLGWNLAAEPLASTLLSLWHHQGDKIYRYFPGNAASAVTDRFLGGDFALLKPWQGAVVLLLYAVVFAALGARLTMRRDVT
ncbi:MAG: hypothetical protein M3O55_07280 [Actinomycetota bacterium]|nr:hypothetical protein [Actinomycetota bacterium]